MLPLGRRTTPNLLRALLAAICLCALLLCAAAFQALGQRRAAIKTIATDSAPSILAAQGIRAYLADMDANATNELIALPGQNMDAVRGYETRRQQATDNLITAAQNITFGKSERDPILALANGLATYERSMTQARDFHERGDPAMLAAYRQADDILHKTLLPAVDALDKVNNDSLTTTYAAQKTGATVTTALTMLAGLLLLGALIATQFFLLRRMRRMINPALLVATLVTVIYMLHTLNSFYGVGSHLKIAKEDAFDSVRALWLTRATAFDANADESRWLLDRTLAGDYEKAFQSKSALIAAPPAGSSAASVAEGYLSDHTNQKNNTFKGFLADELNNITFPGEKEAAVATLQNWGRYLDIDTKLRALENAGKHKEAIALCIGNDPGQSNWAYTQFDDALDKTLMINQTEFDLNIKEAKNILQPFDIINPIVLILVVALAFAGMWPRMREYAF